MSRSRKKNPVVKDYSRGKNGTRLNKRFASKATRNYKGVIPDGNYYKKIYCSWNIFDQRCWWLKSDIDRNEFVTEEYIKKTLRK